VTDFGLAKARAAGAPHVTNFAAPQASALAGYMTPAYCSPEQAQIAAGGSVVPISQATDVWSWAISVWEMSVGSTPVRFGQTAAQAFEGYHEEPWRDDAQMPETPAQVADLLERCLDPNPQTRPCDLGALADELSALYAELTGQRYSRAKPDAMALVADGLNNHALSMLELGQTEQAEQLWRQALARDPHHLHVVYNYGLYRWRSGAMTDTDVIDAPEAVRSWNPSPDADLLLALVHQERHDTVTARTLLTAACRCAPDDRRFADALLAAEDNPALAEPRTLSGHTRTVQSVAVSGDGRVAVSGSDDCTVRIWELRSGACLHTLTGHGKGLSEVSLSPDGRIAVSGDDDVVRVWNVSAGRCLRTLGRRGDPRAIAVLPGAHRRIHR
jgi:tetratricopeptide (TPR) repeat protein